jgi:hypothetical protein
MFDLLQGLQQTAHSSRSHYSEHEFRYDADRTSGGKRLRVT